MKVELNKNFKISPEFAKLIPPLTHTEKIRLESSLKKEGCREALVVWNGTLIDGHNRYKFCTANGIDFKVIQKDFVDEDEAKLWMIENQMARRNLNAAGMLVLERGRQEILARQADKRKKAGKKLDHSVKRREGCGKTSEILAEKTGISPRTIERFNYISKNANDDDETIRLMCEGSLDDDGKKISITREYNKLKQKERQEELRHKGFPLNKYDVLYADPRPNDWELMKKYPVNEMAKTLSILFLWSPVPDLKHSMDMLDRWGFQYDTTILWDFMKPYNIGRTKITHEFLLIAHKGDWVGSVPETDGEFPCLIKKEREGKIRPKEYKHIIHKLYPTKLKVDLFGDEQTEGWENYNQEENAKHLWR